MTIENEWSDDWPAFWAEKRVLSHCPHLAASLAQRVRVLAATLPDRLPRRQRAALLHGDLWVGNVLFDGERLSGLIDQAGIRTVARRPPSGES